MADYPSSIYSPAALTDGLDDVLTSHQNLPNAEIAAIETELGTNPKTINDTVTPAAPSSVAAYLDMLANIVKTISGSTTWTNAAAATILKSIGTTKGDIIAFSGSATPVRVAGSTTDGDVLTRGSTETAGVKWLALPYSSNTIGFAPGGRLTLTSGTPVTSTDVTGSTSVYYTPYVHNCIELWTGSVWQALTFSESTLSVGTVTSGLPYDVFGYLNSGALAVEKLAWTSATARATGVSLQDGRYCKTGDKTRLYLGTFCASSTAATEDSTSKRFLWNMYSRVSKLMSCVDSTDTWNYTLATWRAADNNTTTGQGRVEFVVGLAEDVLQATHQALCYNANSPAVAVGIALDVTNANHAQVYGGFANTNGVNVAAFYRGVPAAGYHYLQRVEISTASGTTTWIGDNGGSIIQTGMVASLKV